LDDGVVSGFGCRHWIYGAGVGVPGFHGGVGDHRARGIGNRAGDGSAIALSKRGRKANEKESKNGLEHLNPLARAA